MKCTRILLLLFAVALAACSGETTLPVISDALDDIATLVATNTPEPAKPTDTPPPTAEPTETPSPTVTPEPTATIAPETVKEKDAEVAADDGKSSSNDGETATTSKSAGAPPSDAITLAGATMPGDQAGIACFGTSGDGVSCLSSEGEWQTFTRSNSDLGGDFIGAIGNCNDRTLLIGHSSGLTEYDGQVFRNYEDNDSYSTTEAITCDADNNIWIVYFDGVSFFDGTEWTTWDSSVLGNESLVYDVEIAPDGTVWVLTSGSIASYDGRQWTAYTEGDGLDDQYFFEAMTIDSAGVLWAAHSTGFLSYADGEWVNREGPDWYLPEDVLVDRDGNIWMGEFSDGIVIYNGRAWSTLTTRNGLSSDKVNALLMDGIGRIWVATNYGLSIRDGETWLTYTTTNADLTVNELTSIAIIGGGPILPAPIQKASGGLTGSIRYTGEVLANAPIEICVEKIYGSDSGKSPCIDQPLFFQTMTDANGEFSFNEIPPAQYAVVVDTGNGWVRLTSNLGLSSQMVSVTEGEIRDVGQLTIEDE